MPLLLASGLSLATAQDAKLKGLQGVRTKMLLAQGDIAVTGQMMNGRAWLLWTNSQRTYYVVGMHDMIVLDMARQSDDPRERKKYLEGRWASRFVVGDYIKELTKFYDETENVRVPIPLAMTYCTHKLDGTLTKEGLVGLLAAIRQKTAEWE